MSRRGLRRSIGLLRAFRLEQSDPEAFYGHLAADTVAGLAGVVSLDGANVLDVGGGSGYLADALRQVGASAVLVDPDPAELGARGRLPAGAVRGDGGHLPLRSAAMDVVLCSNVLEHTSRPYELCEELIRVAKPGAVVWISFTNWFSPWGGHETSPWHYLGWERALVRYRSHYGREPKNVYGENLFRVHIGPTLAWARGLRDAEVVLARPRYYPPWASFIVRVPAVREVATWNIELVLRRRGG
jgi:SAM-dependent methyltransferase